MKKWFSKYPNLSNLPALLVFPLVIAVFLCVNVFAADADKQYEADQLHLYKAKVTDVYDGDTVTVDIDLGYDIILINQKLRLADVDAPEVRGDERDDGIIARDRVRELINGKTVYIQTIKAQRKDSFGRWIAAIYLSPDISATNSVGAILLTEGLVKPYN